MPTAAELRQQLLSALGDERVKAQESLTPLSLEKLYIPLSHRKAFDWGTSLIVGMRGAGKSVWTAAMTDPTIRTAAAALWKEPLLTQTNVAVLHGLRGDGVLFPSPEAMRQFHEQKINPEHVWIAVALHALKDPHFAAENWPERIQKVQNNISQIGQRFADWNKQYAEHGRRFMFIFDSLDRLSDDWDVFRAYAKAAMMFARDLRVHSHLRVKLFLRPDHWDDPNLWAFNDSSKLKQGVAELSWSPEDLYGLLRHIFENADAQHVGAKQLSPSERSKDALEKFITLLAGAYMGANARQGKVYSWIPSHLADAKERVSPRSLLLSIHQAAERTDTEHPDHNFALHHKCIRDAVTAASITRLDELTEDYPWVATLLTALKGLSVPSQPEIMIERWRKATIANMRRFGKLPPRRFTTDELRKGQPEMLIDDMKELAVFYEMSDGRINIPDIFRVAAGVTRKGGVPAVR